MPSNLFVDTSFFIALLNKEDDDHAQALTLQSQISAQIFRKYTSLHINMGIEVLLEMQRREDKGHCYQF